MMFTLGQAAREVGVGKATISRAIHSGRLSADRNDTGGWSIDPAELYRVWSPKQGNGTGDGPMERSATPDESPALKAEIDGLKALLTAMERRAETAEEDRDRWHRAAENAQRQAETTSRLLADLRPAEQQPAKGGLFGWLKAG